jgi:hypothetical protein
MAEHWKKLIEKALEILEMANMSPEEWSFGGGSALTMYYHHRETPWEIVTKKLFYRPESLKIRDIIDTAVVLKNERKKMVEQIPIIAPKFEIIDLRWKNVKEFYEKEAEKLIIHDKSIVDIGKKVFDDYLAEIKIYLKI